MGDRIKTIFESGTLKIEYDVNCAEFKFSTPSDGWASERDAAHGAVALAQYLLNGALGRASNGPLNDE